jgi:hypothetical protein
MTGPERFRADLTDPRHGTQNGYTNLRCRCQPCRDVHAETVRRARARRASDIPADIHGKASTYQNYACRCRPCTDASTAEKRRHRTPVTGVHRPL